MAAGTLRAQQPSLQLWITDSDEAGVVAGLEEQPALSFRANTDDGVATIAVDERKIYQRMEGGGAAFTDGAAWLINQKLSTGPARSWDVAPVRPARRDWHQLLA
jgi:hypothetical protein